MIKTQLFLTISFAGSQEIEPRKLQFSRIIDVPYRLQEGDTISQELKEVCFEPYHLSMVVNADEFDLGTGLHSVELKPLVFESGDLCIKTEIMLSSKSGGWESVWVEYAAPVYL